MFVPDHIKHQISQYIDIYHQVSTRDIAGRLGSLEKYNEELSRLYTKYNGDIKEISRVLVYNYYNYINAY